MNSKSTTALFFAALAFLVFLEGCYPFAERNCDDVVNREFVSTEEALFPPYQEGDTIPFLNLKDNTQYYLICRYREYDPRHIGYDDDYYCDNGGYWITTSRFKMGFSSNYKYTNNNELYVNFEYRTGTGIYSQVLLDFSWSLYQRFNLSINSKTGHFEYVKKRSKYDKVNFSESVLINGKVYTSVYTFYNNLTTGYESALVDTVYFNSSHGILKLISREADLELVLE